MTTKQLSIFLENKTGRLNDVAKILSESSINMKAFSIADNTDFGILRVLVSDTDKAYQILKQNGFAVKFTDVITLHISNTPGSLYSILDLLATANIYIEYMYAFSEGEQASVVIRPDNLEEAVKVLKQNNIQ
ncbi:MAG: amino acid-binding protein [Paludibacteraceae bacterium]|jgi:hypothetical protein|nr:amino acid-binding protein [Paludibacteraceae bacterium]MEE1183390.1 amino acid-binding protein [Paludibacteraceae bacterium]